MNKFIQVINISIPLIAWRYLTYRFIDKGNTWAAIFALIPFIAFVLYLISPNKGPGSFAFRAELGPDIKKEEESSKQYHLRMAKWWFLGSLTFPLSILIVYTFNGQMGITVPFSFLGILFGIASFFKGIGSLLYAKKYS